MKNLFSEEEIVVTSGVKISLKGKKDQSKNQLAFNRLISRVQKLESTIMSERIKVDRLFQFYQKTISPKQLELAAIKIDYAFAFDELTDKVRLSKSVTKKIKESIVLLFEEAFEFIEPTEKQEALFDKWADVSYKDDIAIQNELSKNMFSSFVEDMFGNSINLDDLDLDDPESLAEYEAKMKALFEENSNSKSNSKKKTKKQLEKENQIKADELAQNKSLRSIYISLTKILHPDTETEEVLKKEKEEIMKTVTSAYESKDLSALLKLEMEWVFKTSEHLEKLADDKLKIYISVLKERVSELEQEKFMLYRNPRLMDVFGYLDLKESKGFQLIQEEEFLIISVIEDFKGDISSLKASKNKSQIKELIEEFHEEYVEDGFGYGMFDEDDDEEYW